MRTEAFDYHLPSFAIAQPPARRDASKLLVVHRATGAMEHRNIRMLPQFLRAGDCVVVNDTKVFRARLRGMAGGKPIELLLVRFDGDAWIVLAKPSRRLHIGMEIALRSLRGTVRARCSDGSLRVAFNRDVDGVITHANRIGEIPTPPYIAERIHRISEYQTSYARHVGSVAAPTAGFHCTSRVLQAFRARGVQVASVTLHVGLGTFQPIRTDRIEGHTMHAEWVAVPPETTRMIIETRQRGQRVVAVGTTTLRTLEGVAALHGGTIVSYVGLVNLFITPGFHFRVADALLTNFHLPKSSLLVLVSAFAAPGDASLRGRDCIFRAYQTALAHGYRFYSFGDAMLILA